MKNVLLILFLLCIVMGCSSTRKYKYELLNVEVASFIDATEHRYIMRSYYSNTEEMYEKHIKKGQINKEKRWSCFDNKLSINYVSILNELVPFFRTLATKQKFTIKYRKADGFNNDFYSRTYSEEKFDKIKIESLRCYKKINGNSYPVISEVYNGNK